MAVTVEIKTGQRRAIDFVLAPLREIQSSALHERWRYRPRQAGGSPRDGEGSHHRPPAEEPVRRRTGL